MKSNVAKDVAIWQFSMQRLRVKMQAVQELGTDQYVGISPLTQNAELRSLISMCLWSHL